jgi:hypothetical protein
VSSSSKSPDVSQATLHLAYAEASVLVIEALLQLLIEAKVLPLDTVVDTLEQAIATKRHLVADGTHPEISAVAAGVLSGLANSLAAGQLRAAAEPATADSLPER